MADWATDDGCGRMSSEGENASTTRGTALVSGTANVKGSWVQIVASTPFPTDFLLVQIGNNTSSGGGLMYLVDIAVGAAASEVVLVPNLICSGQSGAERLADFHVCLPLRIPAGTRISMRIQCNRTTETIYAHVTLYQRSFAGAQAYGRVTAYGADTSDSGGLLVDPGASANTKGAWVVLSASTAKPIKGLMLGFGTRGNNAIGNNHFHFVDIGVGAASSEVVVVPDMITMLSTSEIMNPVYSHCMPLSIPAGTRLAARSQSNRTDASDRLFDLVAYGLD